MAKRTRRRRAARTSPVRTSYPLATRAPARGLSRRRRRSPIARRRASVGGGGRGPSTRNILRKSALAAGLGLAQHAGYLARIPALGTLAAETTLGLGCLAVRRFIGGPPILDEIAEVALIVSANRAGARGLAAMTGSHAVSGVGADPYAVEGEDF